MKSLTQQLEVSNPIFSEADKLLVFEIMNQWAATPEGIAAILAAVAQAPTAPAEGS